LIKANRLWPFSQGVSLRFGMLGLKIKPPTWWR
jgi:hypothetical protein